MNPILKPLEVKFSRTVDGLDVVRRRFYCEPAHEKLMAKLPERYSPDEIFKDMYLVNVDGRESGQNATTVELVYQGLFDKKLPADSHATGSALQQAQFTSDSGKSTLTLTYVGPTSTKTTITRERPEGSIGALTPVNATPINAVFHTSEGFTFPTTLEGALAFFRQQIVVLPRTIELVPGKFYQNVETKSVLLFQVPV